jgi:hypothetical protein
MSEDPSSKWIWISKWTISRDSGLTDMDGWRYAQRWESPERAWISDPVSLTPISRSGLVSRRKWIRIMKRSSLEQSHIQDTNSPGDHPVRPDIRQHSEGMLGSIAGNGSASPVRTQPTRPNTMGARLVGLVAGTSKGK